jgi:hypothetical protein
LYHFFAMQSLRLLLRRKIKLYKMTPLFHCTIP